MNSGTIVQSRAQVLIGSRWPVACRSTLASSRVSTYGPFFSERLMIYSPFSQAIYSSFRPASGQGRSLFFGVVRAGPAAADDGRVRRLALFPGLAALGQDAGGAARVAAAGGAALAAAHRVVDRVHRRAAVVR